MGISSVQPQLSATSFSKEPGSQFPPEKNRYHLYVSYACPWHVTEDRDHGRHIGPSSLVK
ncbi:hypothetical protein CSPAE12_09416 [Colletotrichum incanum]|nr:hypothetical protein CSPAE12_09416 [Colletotrichum incanum]